MISLFSLSRFFETAFTFYMGGGGTPGPSTTNVQNSNLPEYVQPYVEGMLGSAQQQIYNMDGSGNISGFKPYVPYSDNPQDYFAGFSPLQNQSFQSAANLQTPGQFGQATGFAGASGLGAFNTANQASQAGNNYNQMATNPNATQAFMNPYLNASLQPQLSEIGRQYDITGQQEKGQATGQGAFGGNRQALMQSENARNKNTAMNQAIGTGYDKAFQAAQQAQQYGAGLGLQGQQAALQGYGQLGQAASTLGNLGTSQLAAQQGVLNTQNTMGAQQQAQEQGKINQAISNYATAQQYPMMQLGNMSNLLHGLPMSSTTTQTYQAAPSAISQFGSLGTGLIGASKLAGAAKKGGSTADISRRGGDGIDKISMHELMSYKE